MSCPTSIAVLARRIVRSFHPSYPNDTSVTRLAESGETSLFKQSFAGWLEDDAIKGLQMKVSSVKWRANTWCHVSMVNLIVSGRWKEV